MEKSLKELGRGSELKKSTDAFNKDGVLFTVEMEEYEYVKYKEWKEKKYPEIEDLQNRIAQQRKEIEQLELDLLAKIASGEKSMDITLTDEEFTNYDKFIWNCRAYPNSNKQEIK